MGRAPFSDKGDLKKGPWTLEEDQKLVDYININGCGNWRTLPKNAGLQRCGKSCRLRWTNYLRPDIKRGRFSFEEEETIIQLHSILGNKWSAIAAQLPGRTDNEIKNYWNTHIRKRFLRMGIDPVTHSPRLDLLDISTISQSQMIFSRLLRMQSLINPELIRLASSILSSQHQNQENFHTQNPVQNHLPISTSLDAAITSVPSISQQHEVMQYDDVHQFQQNLSGFGQANHDWQQSIEDYVPYQNYGYYGSGQAPSSETSTFDQSNSNNFSSFQTVFSSGISTRSSSANLDSNSNYVNSSSTTTEDERESYCSSILKYEIPDYILDVNDYM